MDMTAEVINGQQETQQKSRPTLRPGETNYTLSGKAVETGYSPQTTSPAASVKMLHKLSLSSDQPRERQRERQGEKHQLHCLP